MRAKHSTKVGDFNAFRIFPIPALQVRGMYLLTWDYVHNSTAHRDIQILESHCK